MQRGAFIFDFSRIFTKDLKVFWRIGDFWRFRMFFWKFVVFFNVFAFGKASMTTEFMKFFVFLNVFAFCEGAQEYRIRETAAVP